MPDASAWLPRWEFEEVHRRRGVRATAAQLMAAAASLDERDDAWLQALLALREWPARLRGRLFPARATLPPRRFGRADFVLLQQTPERVVFGLAGRFWQADFGLERPDGPDGFCALLARTTGGIALLTLEFSAFADDAGTCTLETATRVHCTDADCRRRFTPYWWAIRPFSGLVRRRLLRQIQRHAAAGQQAAR